MTMRHCDTHKYQEQRRTEIAIEMLGRGTHALRFANEGMGFRQIMLALMREGKLWESA